VSTVQLVDLATGACVPQNDLHPRAYPAAGRLPDGRIVCAGGIGGDALAEVWGPATHGAADAAWTWRALPLMSDEHGHEHERSGCRGCVMSDGRFAVLGGEGFSHGDATSCEALSFDDGDAHWVPLSPLHDAREFFACGAVDRCVLVAGGMDGDGDGAELYDRELNRWLRLPHDLPHNLSMMGSALL
jgi:hypothetical protein